jgi:hypothetical protein
MLKELNPPPEQVWIEPRPGLADGNEGPVKDVGVRTGLPDLESLPSIAELRLFWPQATLHYVADDDGYRWAAFALEQTKLPIAEGQAGRLTDLTEDSPSIVWRRDFAERFHPRAAAQVGIKARVRAFRKDDRLVTWWLVEENAGTQPRADDSQQPQDEADDRTPEQDMAERMEGTQP